MICNNCGGAVRAADGNATPARCAPATLDRTITGDQMVITAAAIERGTSYF
jgi:hypothetical protein